MTRPPLRNRSLGRARVVSRLTHRDPQKIAPPPAGPPSIPGGFVSPFSQNRSGVFGRLFPPRTSPAFGGEIASGPTHRADRGTRSKSR